MGQCFHVYQFIFLKEKATNSSRARHFVFSFAGELINQNNTLSPKGQCSDTPGSTFLKAAVCWPNVEPAPIRSPTLIHSSHSSLWISAFFFIFQFSFYYDLRSLCDPSLPFVRSPGGRREEEEEGFYERREKDGRGGCETRSVVTHYTITPADDRNSKYSVSEVLFYVLCSLLQND